MTEVEEKRLEERDAIVWKKVPPKESPYHKCKKCERETFFHPNYVNANLSGCCRPGCEKIEDIAKRLVEYRGYKFIKMEKRNGDDRPKVHFLCNKGDKSHSCIVSYYTLKNGSGCEICRKGNLSNKKKIIKINPEECKCKGRICQHYNFGVLYPHLIDEWNYKDPRNEGLTPYKIAPQTNKKYWFLCKKYNEPYKQKICNKVNSNSGCPFCAGQKVCLGNCLLTTHPELCKELTPESLERAMEITFGSNEKLDWICYKHDEPHIFTTSPNHRTGSQKVGCNKCNYAGYEFQSEGGHEYFVKKCNEIYFGKYEYNDKYVKNDARLNIYCSINYEGTNIPHGNFSKTPNHHLSGQGCPKCTTEQHESKYMKEIKTALGSLNLVINTDYITEQKFPGLIYKFPLPVDISIPPIKIKGIDKHIIIERDGEHHFQSIKKWGGNEALESTRLRDCIKDLYFLKYGAHFIRIPYNFKVTPEYLNYIFDLCRKSQVYMSYSDYHQNVSSQFDLKTVNAIVVKSPPIVTL